MVNFFNLTPIHTFFSANTDLIFSSMWIFKNPVCFLLSPPSPQFSLDCKQFRAVISLSLFLLPAKHHEYGRYYINEQSRICKSFCLLIFFSCISFQGQARGILSASSEEIVFGEPEPFS